MYVIKFENKQKELHHANKPLKQDRKCGSAVFSVLFCRPTEPEFLNVYGAQESIPMNQFHQTM
jgi:hypothetical protein